MSGKGSLAEGLGPLQRPLDELCCVNEECTDLRRAAWAASTVATRDPRGRAARRRAEPLGGSRHRPALEAGSAPLLAVSPVATRHCGAPAAAPCAVAVAAVATAPWRSMALGPRALGSAQFARTSLVSAVGRGPADRRRLRVAGHDRRPGWPGGRARHGRPWCLGGSPRSRGVSIANFWWTSHARNSQVALERANGAGSERAVVRVPQRLQRHVLPVTRRRRTCSLTTVSFVSTTSSTASRSVHPYRAEP